MPSRVLIALSIILLAGCSSAPVELNSRPAEVPELLGSSFNEIEPFGNPDTGITAIDSRLADLKPSATGVAGGDIYVVVSDKANGKYRVQIRLPVTKIDFVALVPYGNMGHLRQVHVISGVSKVVFSYGFGESNKAEAFHRRLIALGAKDGTAPTRYVERPGEAGAFPIFIPIR